MVVSAATNTLDVECISGDDCHWISESPVVIVLHQLDTVYAVLPVALMASTAYGASGKAVSI